MPSGATVVLKDTTTGKRELNGYEFFYNGWTHPFPDETNNRMGATKQNLFPENRVVQLDKDYLRKMGLTKKLMEVAMHCSSTNYYCLLLMGLNQGYSMTSDLVFTKQWRGSSICTPSWQRTVAEQEDTNSVPVRRRSFLYGMEWYVGIRAITLPNHG